MRTPIRSNRSPDVTDINQKSSIKTPDDKLKKPMNRKVTYAPLPHQMTQDAGSLMLP